MAKHTIIICGNNEVLTNGSFLSVGNDLRDEASEIVQAGADIVRNAKHEIDYRIESNFQAWNGGYCYMVGNRIGETLYGYGCCHAVTQSHNPPKWLTNLIDKVSHAMSAKAAELGRRQSAQLAQDVIDAVANDDEPSQWLIDNLSRDELSPELLRKFNTAVAAYELKKDEATA